MELKTKYKWIRFEKGHSNDWVCLNKDEECLGIVEYNKGWRQFTFEPDSFRLIFNFRCLEDIADFLKQLNKTKGCYKENK